MGRRLTWKNPPAVVAVGGTETFLVGREVRNAALVTERSGRRTVWADSDSEVIDNITVADTFGDACLIIVSADKVEADSVREIQENQPDKTGLLVHFPGKLDEKKYPFLEEIHAGFHVEHNAPTKKKDKVALAVRFARAEADNLLGAKGVLDPKLAQALVGAVGTDLGTIAFELSKMAALARHEGSKAITVPYVKSLLRPSSEIDMQPLRDAMMARDRKRVASALDRIRRTAPSDPVMLLLRGRGAPGDLALKWLRAAVLLEQGASADEIAARTGTPEWATKRDVIPAARRWGASRLRDLVKRFARADRGVLRGDPSPWVSLESALLLGCSG